MKAKLNVLKIVLGLALCVGSVWCTGKRKKGNLPDPASPVESAEMLRDSDTPVPGSSLSGGSASGDQLSPGASVPEEILAGAEEVARGIEDRSGDVDPMQASATSSTGLHPVFAGLGDMVQGPQASPHGSGTTYIAAALAHGLLGGALEATAAPSPSDVTLTAPTTSHPGASPTASDADAPQAPQETGGPYEEQNPPLSPRQETAGSTIQGYDSNDDSRAAGQSAQAGQDDSTSSAETPESQPADAPAEPEAQPQPAAEGAEGAEQPAEEEDLPAAEEAEGSIPEVEPVIEPAEELAEPVTEVEPVVVEAVGPTIQTPVKRSFKYAPQTAPMTNKKYYKYNITKVLEYYAKLFKGVTTSVLNGAKNTGLDGMSVFETMTQEKRESQSSSEKLSPEGGEQVDSADQTELEA